MALNLDNFDYEQPTGAGFSFEREVREYLKSELPNDYVFRAGVLHWDGGYGKEIDFLVVGPKGVIIIEAKQIDGAVIGGLSDENWMCTAYGKEAINIKRPLHLLKNKMHAVSNKFVGQKPFYLHYRNPLGIFVFSDKAIIDSQILECNKNSPAYRATHLKDLGEVISHWTPINRDNNVRALNVEDAKKIISWVTRTNIDPRPEMIGPYKIISVGDKKLITENGLAYSIGKVVDELGAVLRGKRYKIPDNENVDFEHLLPQLRRHATVIKELDHPNIHRYYAFLRSASGREFWVIERGIDGQTLAELLGGGDPLAVKTIRRIMRDVALGLHALHSKGIIHRELTPEAIIIEHGTNRPIITNFELAKLVGDPHSVAGERLRSSPYRASEVETDPHNVDASTDIYSWGSILYRLLTGEEYSGEFPLLAHFPKELHNDLAVAERCVVPAKGERPQDFSDILGLSD